MKYREYTFLGVTESLCPDCLDVVPARIIARGERVYFRKRCPAHGTREDFVCSDLRWFDRTEYSLPGKVPHQFGASVHRGCPYDCGLCEDHEQHTCIGLLEINSACNLECPMCFASSGPRGSHLTPEECRRAIDRLVEVEGQPEILQLSGGEPTIHPQFEEVLEHACAQPIDIVMINTNGIRIARDARFREMLAGFRDRIEIYLQFDGFSDDGYSVLRGEPLVDVKLRAIEELGKLGLRTILVSTVQTDVNDQEPGGLVEFATARSWITGVSFQPATYSGRCVLPEELDRRITFPDIIKRIAEQTAEWSEPDFTPLPCAHPNAHTLAYAYRHKGSVIPLARFLDLEEHLDLLSGRITFDRPRARKLILDYLDRQPCSAGGCANPDSGSARGDVIRTTDPVIAEAASDFLTRALAQQLDPEHMLRITTTSFMDAYNFDIRQLMKSCVHFVLPTGHIIPFSAYNVLYRTGHLTPPPIDGATVELTL